MFKEENLPSGGGRFFCIFYVIKRRVEVVIMLDLWYN